MLLQALHRVSTSVARFVSKGSWMSTIGELFPGNMGRVQLTRVALKMRMPALMQMAPHQPLDAVLLTKLTHCLAEVQKG